MKDALQEAQEYSEKSTEQSDGPSVHLIKATAITIDTEKDLQSGIKAQQKAKEPLNIGNNFPQKKNNTSQNTQKTIRGGLKTHSDLFQHTGDIIRRNSYISASVSLFSNLTNNLLHKNMKKTIDEKDLRKEKNSFVKNNTVSREIWPDMMNISGLEGRNRLENLHIFMECFYGTTLVTRSSFLKLCCSNSEYKDSPLPLIRLSMSFSISV